MLRLRKKEVVQDLVLVIVKSNDSSADYHLPRARAKELLERGQLSLIYCYEGRWDYFDQYARFKRERIPV